MQFNPFFINTNLCYTQQECTDLPTFLNNVSGNTGNSYIAYSVIKLLYGKLIPVAEIKNLWTYSFQNQEALINQINQKHSHVILLLQDQIRLTQSYGINPNWQKINTFLKQLKNLLLCSAWEPMILAPKVRIGGNIYPKILFNFYIYYPNIAPL